MKELDIQLTPLRTYAVAGLAATVLAIRRDEPARPFGIGFPGPVAAQALVVGTGLSAPVPMLPLVWQARSPKVKGMLAAMFLVGALGEPVTWRTLRRPLRNPLVTAVVVANIALPVIHLATRSREAANGASVQPTGT
ncbi:MAG TPA: hypothetical protein VF855_12155 [Acidimicrobiales bacterium]